MALLTPVSHASSVISIPSPLQTFHQQSQPWTETLQAEHAVGGSEQVVCYVWGCIERKFRLGGSLGGHILSELASRWMESDSLYNTRI